MDSSKDSLPSARTQRYEDRNMNKDRLDSNTLDESDKKFSFASGTSTVDEKPTMSHTPRTVPDSFAPPAFSGVNADADTWLAHFQRYIEYRQLPADDVIAIFPLFLKETAIDWYETLSRDVKSNLDVLLENFKAYFGKSPLDYVFEDESVFTRAQRPKEKARDYIAQMQRLAKRIPALDEGLLLWVIMKGLRPQIKASVIQHKGDIKSVADILELAKLAESVGLGNDDDVVGGSRMNQLMDEVRAGREEVQKLTARVARMSTSSVQSRSPTPDRRRPRVSFQDPNVSSGTQRNNGPPAYYRGGRGARAQSRFYNTNDRRFTQPDPGMQKSHCDRCGRLHGRYSCPTDNVACFNCGRIGHLRAKCRSARRGAMNISG